MATVDYKLSNGKTIKGVDSRENPADILAIAREDFNDPGLEFSFETEAPTTLERIGAGYDDVFSGVRQAVGEQVAPESTAAFTRTKRDEKAAYERGRKGAGRDGLDWWRIGGAVLASSPAMLIPGGQTMAARSAAGAGVGAGLGYTTFVPGADSGETSASDRFVNTAAGAAVGGAAPKLFDIVGALGRKGVNAAADAARRLVGTVEAPPLGSQVASAWEAARNAAVARGADLPEQMPVQLERLVEADIQAANRAGVAIDPEALARKLELEAAGYSPRTGQVTRDQKTFAAEENMRARSTPEGEMLQAQIEQQSRKMGGDLEALAGRFGARIEGLPGEKGQRIMDTIEAEWKRTGDEVSKAYTQAREARGDVRADVAPLVEQVADHAFEGGKTALGDMAELAMGRFRKLGLIDADGNLKEGASLTLSQLEDLRKGLSRIGTIKGTTPAETLRAKSIITNLVDDVTERSPAGDVFAPARASARARFQMFEGKALDDVLSGKADPERFFQRHVLGAGIADLKKTMAALEAAPDGAEVAQMMRREMMDLIMEKAAGADGFVTASGLDRGIKLVGRDKIKQVLGDDVLRDLEKNQRFAQWLFTEPAVPGGSLVNRSRTAAESERIRLGEGGITGAILNKAQDVAESAAAERAAMAALRGGIAPTAPRGGVDLFESAANRGAQVYNTWLNGQKKTVRDLMRQLEPAIPDAARAGSVTLPTEAAIDFMRNR